MDLGVVEEAVPEAAVVLVAVDVAVAVASSFTKEYPVRRSLKRMSAKIENGTRRQKMRLQ